MLTLKTIGAKARRYRLEQKFTVKELSKALGYTINTIYKFERGELNNSIILAEYIKRGLTL